jgi:hypothetical protein
LGLCVGFLIGLAVDAPTILAKTAYIVIVILIIMLGAIKERKAN